MNNRLIYICLFFFSISNSFGQDPKAEAILSNVNKKYQAIKAYTADFVYELESVQTKIKEKFSGKIIVKGNKFMLKLGNQEVINNGTTVWTYMKEENEVNISDYTPDENEISPTKIHSMYKNGFKYAMSSEEKSTPTSSIIDLTPEDKTKPFFKVRIWINKKDNSVKSWKIFEKNGNKYLYSVTKFTPSNIIEDKAFTFDKSKYKGVEVVDLR